MAELRCATSLNAPYSAPCFPTRRNKLHHLRHGRRVLMHLMVLRAFWQVSLTHHPSSTRRLNAPYGAPYFLTPRLSMVRVFSSPCLNAPYGAPCFLTARRVAPAVTRGNDTSDRQGPKKHESDPQARRQISRLFVAIRCIATDGQPHSSRPGNSRSRRRVAPLHAYTTPHAKQPTNRAQTGSSHFGVWGVVLAWGRGLPDD